jgi:uncharacterized phiE125 gp8 family phage protein
MMQRPIVKVSWAMTVPPATEPVTLTEAKQHARISQTNDDAVITTFITVAREQAEEHMRRGILTQTWQLALDWWYEEIWLPRAAPLQSVTSIQYYDTAGVQQTLAASVYDVDSICRPARIVRKPGQTWPALQAARLTPRITVTYVVGWTGASLVPERIKQGIRAYVAYLDADREGMDQDAEKARMTAEYCWNDRVNWIEPGNWCQPLSMAQY